MSKKPKIKFEDLPHLVTEIHRYSKPTDMFAFHYLVPDDTDTWNVQPFTSGYYDEGYDKKSPRYREAGTELYYDDQAEALRATLKQQGFEQLDLSMLPEELVQFVIYSQAPIEWHNGLAKNVPEVAKRVTVWVQGELPT